MPRWGWKVAASCCGATRGTPSDPNQRAFVSFSGGILAEYYSGGTIFDHPDQIGSMSTSSDYTGNTLNEKLFYPFGELWTGAAIPNFNTHQTFAHLPDYDPETDQYNTLNRHYSPSGRWLSPDPGGVKIVKLDDPQTWNMYAYVRNNPTTLTDPTGLAVATGGNPNCEPQEHWFCSYWEWGRLWLSANKSRCPVSRVQVCRFTLGLRRWHTSREWSGFESQRTGIELHP